MRLFILLMAAVGFVHSLTTGLRALVPVLESLESELGHLRTLCGRAAAILVRTVGGFSSLRNLLGPRIRPPVPPTCERPIARVTAAPSRWRQRWRGHLPARSLLSIRSGAAAANSDGQGEKPRTELSKGPNRVGPVVES